MAEGFALKWLQEHRRNGWLAISAGVFASDGTSTSPETIHALSNHGISFEGSSTLLTREMAKAATIVVCMSASHLSAVNQFTDKAELLDPAGDIFDPIGSSQSMYDELANQMEQLVAHTLERIVN
jgi:protein-tyrosine-phosphatase